MEERRRGGSVVPRGGQRPVAPAIVYLFWGEAVRLTYPQPVLVPKPDQTMPPLTHHSRLNLTLTGWALLKGQMKSRILGNCMRTVW